MPRQPVVVLVEGASDAAVLSVLAEPRGLADRIQVVAMGGATNIGRHVRRLAGEARGATVLGLCDVGERRFLERALPALDGVFACDRDLEDELIRAVGPDRVLDVLAATGELERFRVFQGQPGWREAALHDQLRRFAGTRSGRKAVLARRLAAVLSAEAVPEPLVRLLDRVAEG